MEYSNTVLVYPSNTIGSYRRGIAHTASTNWGAKLGVVNGPDGDNAYAIATKDEDGSALDLRTMKLNVDRLINYAMKHPKKTFKVPSFHMLKAEDIAPMFALAPKNMKLPKKYKDYILEPEGRTWWSA